MTRVKRHRVETATTPSAVPDVLGPGLDVVFCGINPGRVSDAAKAHFANPRNDFWRLLHEAGFTPRQLEPHEQFELLRYGIGATNAAFRTTPGSSDLRRADFAGSAERLERIALELRPRAIAFVGKEAFRGAFGTRRGARRPDANPRRRGLVRPPLDLTRERGGPVRQRGSIGSARSKRGSSPTDRAAVASAVLDEEGRTLLVQFRDESGQVWWATPGGGVDEHEDVEQALRRELAEEIGLDEFELGPEIWTREHTFAWNGRILRQRERIWLVEVASHEPAPRVDLAAELVADVRWWTPAELEAATETLVPERLPQLLRELRENGPPTVPFDAGL